MPARTIFHKVMLIDRVTFWYRVLVSCTFYNFELFVYVNTLIYERKIYNS